MKKIISFVISLCMVFAMVPAVSFAASVDAQDQAAAQEPAEQVLVQQNEAGDQDAVEQPVADQQAFPSEEEEPAEDIPYFEFQTEQWVQDETGWKYFTNLEEQVFAMGKVMVGGATYYFDLDTGYMKVKWVTDIDGSKYYCNPEGTAPDVAGSSYGAMVSGWKVLSNKKYYFNPTSFKMKTGWLTQGSDRYYFGENGVMKTGMKKLDTGKYYFEPKSGKMHTGWLKYKNCKYYFSTSSGKACTGWLKLDGYRYHFTSTGVMQTGWKTIDGNKYYFTKSGKARTGLCKINGYRYYFSDSGVMKTGAIRINGSLYYFFTSGKNKGRAVNSKGWFYGSDRGHRYSLGNGKVATGTKKIGGYWYEFSKSTGICTRNLGDKYDRQANKWSSNTRYLVYVIKSNHQTRIYSGSKGKWKRIYTFSCALGKSSTPTQSGTFTVDSKTPRHEYNEGGSKVHWNNGVNFGGDCGFNGYVWNQDGSIHDSRLGSNVSGGRVRVAENNSVWMYNNITIGTKVVVK